MAPSCFVCNGVVLGFGLWFVPVLQGWGPVGSGSCYSPTILVLTSQSFWMSLW